MGMSSGSGSGGADRLASFANSKSILPHINNDLMARINNPIKFVHPGGGGPALGYPATLLADLCDAVLNARQEGSLHPQQAHIAAQCEILVRGIQWLHQLKR